MEKYFESRVHAVQEAITRSRTIFLMVNLATVIVVSGLYNGYFTWMVHLVTRPHPKDYDDVAKAISAARVADMSVISLPTVGLKFFVADLGVVAGFAMLVLSLWFYYSVRREQRIAGLLVDYVLGPPTEDEMTRPPKKPEEAEFALFALSSRFVFTILSFDRPAGLARIETEKKPLFQNTVKALIFGPFWSVLLCAIADIVSLFCESRLMPGNPPATAAAPAPTLWQQLTTPEGAEAVGRIVFTLILAGCIFRLTSGVLKYLYLFTRLQRPGAAAGAVGP